MLIKVPLKMYNDTLKSEQRGGMQIHRHYASCMHQLVAKWASRVQPHQLIILMFVLDRTFYYDKLSETIAFDQFLDGMQRADRDEMVFSGLNMSKNTLVLHLKALVKDNFLHAYAAVGDNGITEIRPRLFAINCKKLFNLDIADEENPMKLREPKQKRVLRDSEFDVSNAPKIAESALRMPRNPRAQTPKTTPPNLGGIYTNHDTTKVVYVGAASQAEPQQKIDPMARVNALRQEREAARAARAGNRPTKRTAQKAPNAKATVQRIIDDAMASYFPTLPRMLASDKPLGVLKKRLAAAEVEIEGFIDWAIKFWMTTASQHERAARKRSSEAGSARYAHKPLPSAPDFNSLCYQSPYFIACYRSHLVAAAAGLATTKEELLEAKVAKLERAVASARDTARSAEVRERALRQRTRAAPRIIDHEQDEAPARPARITRSARPLPPTQQLDDDFDIPAWEDHPVARKAK